MLLLSIQQYQLMKIFQYIVILILNYILMKYQNLVSNNVGTRFLVLILVGRKSGSLCGNKSF